MSGEKNNEDISVRDLNGPADLAEPRTERFDEPREERQIEDKPQSEPKTGPFVDKRAAMYEKFKAQRDADEAENGIRALSDDVERSRVGDTVETFADREAKRNAPPEPVRQAEPVVQADAPAPSRKTFRVQGRDIELDETQITVAVQKALAAEDVLEDAKRKRAALDQQLAEAQAFMAANQRQQAASAQTSQSMPEDTKPGDADLEAIIDTIQVGDPKEAAAALSRALARNAAQVEQALIQRIGNIDDRIAATTRQMDADRTAQSEAETALRSFQSENADLLANQTRLKTFQDATTGHMEQALYGIGVEPRAIDAIAAQRNMTRAQAVGWAYTKSRQMGYQLPSYSDVLKDAGQTVRRDFGLSSPQAAPKPQAETQQSFTAERDQRKAAITPQPKRANVAPGSDPAQKSDDDKRLDYIRERRMLLKGRR